MSVTISALRVVFSLHLKRMGAPAGRMEVPTELNTATYANADLTETIKVLERHGVRVLNLYEIHTEMPQLKRWIREAPRS